MAPPRVARWPRSRICDATAIAILTLLALIAALTFRDYGLGWDDYTHSQYGELLLSLYRSGFTDRRALAFVNLYTYGGGFDMAADLVARYLPFDLFETRRLAGAAVGIAGMAVTWRLGRHVGGPVAGVVALILIATCPLYYGHMFINAKDGPFAATMIVLLFALVRVFEDYPSPSPVTNALFGIGLGLSIGSRVIGGIAVLFVIAPLALMIAHDWHARGPRDAALRVGRFAVMLGPGLVIGYLIMGLVWPWSVLAPLNPFRAIEYFSQFFEKPWKEMFEGALVSVPNMPRSYVPVLVALKLPELMLGLSIAGSCGSLAAAFNHDIAARRRAVLLLITGAAVIPIAFTVITRPAMYNGIRHFVFVMPTLAVLGGLAAAWIVQRLPAWPRWATVAAGAVAAIGVVLPATQMVRLHPYQYAHFNDIAGGVRIANDNFMLDYWGLAFKQAAQELRQTLAARHETPAPGSHWRIAVCGPHPGAEVALGPEFDLTWDPQGADFAMMLGEFYCVKPNAPVLAEVVREGVVFARVYDIRGRSLPSLFTIPPVQ